MLQALEGKYVEPGPGGDPIRNPGVLPTGKNIHALDPQSIPTTAAVKNARVRPLAAPLAACSAPGGNFGAAFFRYQAVWE